MRNYKRFSKEDLTLELRARDQSLQSAVTHIRELQEELSKRPLAAAHKSVQECLDQMTAEASRLRGENRTLTNENGDLRHDLARERRIVDAFTKMARL